MPPPAHEHGHVAAEERVRRQLRPGDPGAVLLPHHARRRQEEVQRLLWNAISESGSQMRGNMHKAPEITHAAPGYGDTKLNNVMLS